MIGEGRGVAQPVGVFQQPGVCIPIQLPPRLAPLSCYHLPAHTSAHRLIQLPALPPTKTHHSMNLASRPPPIRHVNSSTSFTCLFTDSPPSFYSLFILSFARLSVSILALSH